MARMHTTPRFPLGTRVLKNFPGYADPFGGEVDGFLPDSGFYHIRYDDGDSEEMTEDDVEHHFYEMPTATRKRHKPQAPPPARATASSPRLSTKTKAKNKARTKMLLLSAPTTREKEEEEDGLADVEEEEEQEAVEEVTSADSIYKLVGQRVCKRQADGIVGGTVSSYFPATKMYRVVYSNGTTDDMTYRDVIDSIPLSGTSSSSPAKTNKRKPTGETATAVNDNNGEQSQVPKKRKTDEKLKIKAVTVVDENTNNENAGDDDDTQAKRSNGVEIDSIMVTPTIDEEAFAWNRNAAYDIVRAVLYVVTSTTNDEVTDARKVLEQKGIKAKVALSTFVERGGLAVLKDRLGLWCQTKETEAGVLVILKVLAVIPGVTSDAILSSDIGKTLSNIRKRKLEVVAQDLDPVVRDMASYVIAKWKKELAGGDESTKQKKALKDSKSKSSSSSSVSSKAVKTGSVKTETSTNNTIHKRSNSAGHLRDLIGGPRGTPARSNDLLGNTLNNGRPGSRPLGALHARVARRSTVLLDNIKSRLEKAELEKSSPTSGDRPVLKPEVWTASRVKFGGHKTLEFDNEVEVSMLMVAPVPGGIRPFRGKNGPPTLPPPGKKPAKPILRVKLAAAERTANAEKLKAEASRDLEEDASERMHIGSISFTESSPSGVPSRPSIDDGKDTVDNSGVAGDQDEEDGKVSRRVAPPSPPRKHDASEDDDDAGDDEEPMPNDIIIGEAPSPPSSETTGDQIGDVGESIEAILDTEDNGHDVASEEPVTLEPVASPVVSPDSLSAESGEIIEEDEPTSHPPSPMPLSSSPSSLAPPQASSPSPAPPTEMGLAQEGSTSENTDTTCGPNDEETTE